MWNRLSRRWLALLLGIGVLAHLRVLVPVLQYSRPPTMADPALFEHAGWYITRGGRLYLDIWEPKPPLPYETTAVIALAVGESAYRYHLTTVLVTIAASLGVMALVGVLARHLSGRRDVGLLAGTSMLVLPGYSYLPAMGFSAKHFVLLCGLLAIYLALADRPFLAGVSAAASVGYWQLAVVFPVLAMGITAQRNAWPAVGRVCLGGVMATAAIVAPVVYWGAVPAMIAEVVVIPLVVPESQWLVPRAFVGGRDLKSGLAVLLVGAAAILLALREPYRRDWWWVGLGGLWFGFVAYAIDYDYFPDAIPGLAFVALGVGLLYTARARLRPYIAGATLASVAVSVGWLGAFGIVADPLPIAAPGPLSSMTPAPIPGDGIVPDVKVLFWEQRIPETCHYRMSALERRWLRLAGYAEECGRLSTALRLLF